MDKQNVVQSHDELLGHKGKEVLMCATTYFNPENIILYERSQSPKSTQCPVSGCWGQRGW